jgi:hypothetical protein
MTVKKMASGLESFSVSRLVDSVPLAQSFFFGAYNGIFWLNVMGVSLLVARSGLEVTQTCLCEHR